MGIEQQKHYEQPCLWGRNLKGNGLERVQQILALITKDVKSVLEIGCGAGVIINRLQERGLDCTGINISKEALKYVKCRKMVMSSDHLEFKEQSFDVVICSEVLEHLPKQVYENTLKEIEGVSRKIYTHHYALS